MIAMYCLVALLALFESGLKIMQATGPLVQVAQSGKSSTHSGWERWEKHNVGLYGFSRNAHGATHDNDYW